MTDKIDACGLSCPQPVILTRRALEEAGNGKLRVVVDTMTHVENCLRAGRSLGWNGAYEDAGGEFVITFTR